MVSPTLKPEPETGSQTAETSSTSVAFTTPTAVERRRMTAPVDGSLISLVTRDHFELIAHLYADFGAHVEHDLAALDGRHCSFDDDGPHSDFGSVGDQVRGQLVHRGLGGLADDGLLKVAGAEVGMAPAEAVPVAPAAQHRGAGAAGLPLAIGDGHDLAGIDVNNARGDGHVRLGVGVADAAQPDAVPVAAAAAQGWSSWSRCRIR